MAAAEGRNAEAQSKIRQATEKGKGFNHFHHTLYQRKLFSVVRTCFADDFDELFRAFGDDVGFAGADGFHVD